MKATADRIREILAADFEPEHLELVDDSARHAGHAGAREGGGHYLVHVVSRRFEGLGRVERHRLVYRALGSMMGAGIHALGLRAQTPAEWRAVAEGP
jgi:BolA protein